jgi:GTPase
MKDNTTISIESGKGGDGLIAFDSKRKADGGNGGKGGDIYIVGNSNVFDFSKIMSTKKFKAQDGLKGQKNKRTGKDGNDIEIQVPLITKVFNSDNTEIVTISKSNYKIKILSGGQGGLGNFSLRGEGWDGKLSRTKGQDCKSKNIILELNLKSDVIFLGYPNAGKSSIVNALTNARCKVASYEFTTLQPQLAVMDHYTLMDLPGLIEGTSNGKGLGTKFIKHTKYSKLLVHCISLENENLEETYQSMRKEFLEISENLYSLPELVVFTKADIYSLEQLQQVKKKLEKSFKDFVLISVFRKEDIKMLKNELKKRLSSTSSPLI